MDRVSVYRMARPPQATRCLRCDYLLEGGPPCGICPECGCSYDAEMVVVRLTILTPVVRGSATAGLILVPLVCIWVQRGSAWMDLWMLVAAGVLVLWPLVRLCRCGWTTFIAISNVGLQYGRCSGEVVTLPWPQLGDVRVTDRGIEIAGRCRVSLGALGGRDNALLVSRWCDELRNTYMTGNR